MFLLVGKEDSLSVHFYNNAHSVRYGAAVIVRASGRTLRQGEVSAAQAV